MTNKLMLLDRIRGTEIQKVMVQSLENGVPVEMAVRIAGISVGTHYGWLKRGEQSFDALDAGAKRLAKADRACLDYLKAVRRAEADAVQRNAMLIQVAAREHWQAAAWYLERRYPDTWGRRDRQEISGPGGAPLQVKAELMHQFMREAEMNGFQPDVVDDHVLKIESTDDIAYVTGGDNSTELAEPGDDSDSADYED
jgi:hypothetical protein